MVCFCRIMHNKKNMFAVKGGTTVANAENPNARCAPVVYYSTADKKSFFRNGFPDEHDSFNLDENIGSIWTTVPPDDLSTVTAVAVDCRRDNKGDTFVLDADKTLDFKINMHAANSMQYNDTYAYNETVTRFTLADNSFGVEYGYVVGREDDINAFLTYYNPTEAERNAYKLQYKGETPTASSACSATTTSKTDSTAAAFAALTKRRAPRADNTNTDGAFQMRNAPLVFIG